MPKCHCGKHASFNVRGETKGRFCKEHKEPNMVDVKNKTCEADGCTIRPNYNIPGGKKGRFCFIHKEHDMVDVIHKICELSEYDEFLPFFPLLKSRINLEEQDLVWEQICKYKNYQFIPSI
jgi:hypothetical protein